MTIQQLKCFVVMSDVLHYTRAAERLHISQPSLSYSISELEKEFGLPLFERSDNKTLITRYGENLLPYAKSVLSNVDAMRAKSYELTDSSKGTINLGNIYSVSFDFLPLLLERFYSCQENSQITINFFQGINKILTEKLMDNSIDLVFSGWPEDDDIQGEHIFTQELKLIVPANHSLASRNEVTLSDVKDEGLISAVENSNITCHIARCFESRGYSANFVLTVAECSAIGALVSSNMGVAIAPVIPPYSKNNIKIISFAEEDRKLLGRKIYMLWQKERHLPPVARKFRSFVLNELRVNHSLDSCL